LLHLATCLGWSPLAEIKRIQMERLSDRIMWIKGDRNCGA